MTPTEQIDTKEQELRKLAEAATPGPWIAAGPSFGAALPAYCDEVIVDREGDEGDSYTVAQLVSGLVTEPQATADMKYIAAANPAAVIALLDRLERAEADLNAERVNLNAGAKEAAAGAVPEGFKLVPVEPTPEMIVAGGKGFQKAGYNDCDKLHDWTACYRAMVAAAPSAPVAAQAEPVEVRVSGSRVWIVKGNQSFMLAYDADTDEEREWYAGQLRAVLSSITPDVKIAIAQAEPVATVIAQMPMTYTREGALSRSIDADLPVGTKLFATPPVPMQEAGKDAWEYSFIHSSALGRVDEEVGPCLTYDEKTAFGVGCIKQRKVSIRAIATSKETQA